MIGLPFHDLKRLGSITEVIAVLVANRDPVIVELAETHGTTDSDPDLESVAISLDRDQPAVGGARSSR